MKKISLCLLSILLSSSIIIATRDIFSGQTFLYPKPAFASLGMQQSSWNSVAYEKKQAQGSAFQATIFYDQTYKTDDAAAYFLFDNKNKLNVSVGITSENNTTKNSLYTETSTRDILGQWLGLTAAAHTQYQGEFSVTPEQKQAGVIFECSQDLKNITTIDFFKHLYVFAALPVSFIENTLKYEGPETIFQAFTNQSIKATVAGQADTKNNWNYLTYPTKSQSSLRLSCVKLGFGTTLINENDIIIATSNTFIVPLAQAVENRTLFEPVQGYNGSFAMASQALFQFPIIKKNNNEATSLCAYFGFENTVITSKKSMRTFDLQDKPFSRYMLFYDKVTDKIEPGVNVLTKKCKVEPYNMINLIAGLRGHYYDAVVEIGYEFWAHPTERVTIDSNNPWEDGRYGIAYIDAQGALRRDGTSLLGFTASKSTISFVAFADGDERVPKSHNILAPGELPQAKYNIYIREQDIDFNSAASQKSHVHRPYISFGLHSKKEKFDFFVNAGAHVSIAKQNSATSTVGGWFKAGLAF